MSLERGRHSVHGAVLLWLRTDACRPCACSARFPADRAGWWDVMKPMVSVVSQPHCSVLQAVFKNSMKENRTRWPDRVGTGSKNGASSTSASLSVTEPWGAGASFIRALPCGAYGSKDGTATLLDTCLAGGGRGRGESFLSIFLHSDVALHTLPSSKWLYAAQVCIASWSWYLSSNNLSQGCYL